MEQAGYLLVQSVCDSDAIMNLLKYKYASLI